MEKNYINEFEFYKELYHKENDKKQHINNSLNIPIAVLTALFSSIFYFATTFDYRVSTWGSAVFIGLLTVASVPSFISLFYLTRSFIGKSYKEMAYAQDLLKWKRDLVDYYKNIGESSTKVEEEFLNFVLDELVKNLDHNTIVNDRKLSFLFNARKYIAVALWVLVTAIIPYTCNFFLKNTEAYKVQIMNDIDKKKLYLDMSKNNQNTPPPPRPTPPPSRDVKEDTVPTRPNVPVSNPVKR